MDPERLRLFVAASIPREHLDRVQEEIAPFKQKVVNARWTPVENQHVTLKFLGSTPADRLDEVATVCEIVAAGREPAQVALTEVGAFPSKNRVRVLWVGLDDPASLLAGVAADLDRGFEPLGFPAEARAYTPHLTLCRFKIPVPLKGGLPELDLSDLPPFDVGAIQLFRSRLSPKGARYEVVREFALGRK
ncbi:MAG: RNA 2',3'-cyclic phosphodiesterase [Actinobacteria bacterium]|nr:RNA 2',3'-cyclic phosphodiesterase [Actinomycetota bacterium]